MQRIHRIVLDAVHADMQPSEFGETWVKEAVEDPGISEEAAVDTLENRYGESVVTWSSNTESNMKALDNGYQVLHPSGFSGAELRNLRRKAGLKSANDLFGREPNTARVLKEEELTTDMIGFRRWVRAVARVANKLVRVEFVEDPGARYVASCTMNSANPTMRFNRSLLSEDFFAGRGQPQLALVIHELGHAEMAGEMSHGPKWGEACSEVGGHLAQGMGAQ